MTSSKIMLDPSIERQLAADLFNATWDLIDKLSRTPNEDEHMVHMAHASRYHWEAVGTPVNFARGEWQLSRVYVLVKRFEPALYHATASLHWCQQNDLGAFDLGFAHEAMARAYALNSQDVLRNTHIAWARVAADTVEDASDRNWLIKNIQSIAT